jgi:methionine-rich copper-binding protein CopC
MKIKLLLSIILSSTIGFGQLKTISETELTIGSGIFFSAEKTITTITVTMKGPSDRYFAVGFGSGMSSGDALIYSNISGIENIRDHTMSGYTFPPVDGSQDWTIISNNIVGVERICVLSRALNSPDPSDLDFTYAQTTQSLFWAKSSSNSMFVSNHNPSNRATGIVRNWIEDPIPTISSTIPTDNSDVVSPSNISITFSEGIFEGTGMISLINDSENSTQMFDVTNPTDVTISGSTLTINTGALAMDRAFHVEYPAGIVIDNVGSPVAALNTLTTLNFTTQGTNPPLLTSLSPADNALNPGISSNLTLTFGEDILKGTGMIQLFKQPNVLVESFNVASSPAVTLSSTNQLSINPTANFTQNTAYFILVPPTAIRDLTNDFYPGSGTDSTVWNFTLTDGASPIILTVLPADETAGVSASANLELNFNETVYAGVGNLEIFDASATLLQTISIPSANVTFTASNVVVNPPIDLPLNTTFYVQLSSGSITDGLNPFIGIIDNTSWNFNTNDITAPILTNSVPADNSMNNNPIDNLILNFSENIQLGTGNVTITGPNGITSIAISNPSISINLNTLEINTSSYPQGNYHVTMPSGVITDIAGNSFMGISDSTILNFNFGDYVPPFYVSSSFVPQNNAINVLPNSLISLQFDEPVSLSNSKLIIYETQTGIVFQEFSSLLNSLLITLVNPNTIEIDPIDFDYFKDYHIIIEEGFVVDNSVNENQCIVLNDINSWKFQIVGIEGVDEDSKNWFEFKNNVLTVPDGVEFELVNTDGKVILSSNKTATNLDHLKTGVYLLREMDSNKIVRIYVD